MIPLKEIVNELAENYQINKDSLPNLENELYSMSGIDSSDPVSILLIPIDSTALQHIGSVCGTVGNKIFSNRSLVSFLRNRDVKKFLGLVSYPDEDETYKEGVISLNSIALPIVGKDGHIFESLVDKLGGSFRYERSGVSGWSVYESE